MKWFSFVILIIFLLTACNPSDNTIQTALSETQTAVPTSTPTSTPLPATSTHTPSPTITLTPTVTPLPAEITDDRGVSMVLVPAGEFTMGSKDGYDDEQPIHQVYLNAFYIDKYEVTNSFYKDCVNAGACTLPSETGKYIGPSRVNHPVVFIDWYQAKAYCEWRDSALPSEAQWEKAARSTDARTYPWGEELTCDRANYGKCILNTTAIGSYESGKSYYGIYDLSGNVWEWVNDWYDDAYYQISPSVNPLGPNTGVFKILRGGAWAHNIHNPRSAFRTSDYPDTSHYNAGFRCAKDAP